MQLDAKSTTMRAALDDLTVSAPPPLIAPTVGRQVWYHPGEEDSIKGEAPLAATIAHVWNDRCVNLQVLDSNGIAWSRTSVVLLHGSESYTPMGNYCEWMPFQKGQAKAQAVDKAAEGSGSTLGSGTSSVGQSQKRHRQALEIGAMSALANQVALSPTMAAEIAQGMKLAINTLLGVPMVETKVYPDGVTVTGLPPLPASSPVTISATGLLYEQIKVAMDAIGEPPSADPVCGYPRNLIDAYDALFRAFWSECPIPASVTYRPREAS